MTTYNYDTFKTEDYDFTNEAGPMIGQRAPDFLLTTIDNKKKTLLDFDGDYLVLELGSVTCPLFHTRREGMRLNAREYPNLTFSVLYVREAHPGAIIPAHKSFDDKKNAATRLRTEDKDDREIFIDDLDGTAHQAYGSMPNAVFIIDKQGIVKFKAEWNNPAATRKAIQLILEGKDVNIKTYFKPAKPNIVLATAKRAGKGSAYDFFTGLPILIWNNLIKRNTEVFLDKK